MLSPPNIAASALVLLLASCAERATAAEVSFTNEVMAVLSKAGCNAGACHGNAGGKGGFRLSLRGQDPVFDYRWLTHESHGRRVNLLEPRQSLILLKPAGQLSHQGGIRFRRDSQEYRLLSAWIAAGAPPPDAHTARLSRLEVTPAEPFLIDPVDGVQLQAVAHFSDGTRRDVTSLAAYDLSNRAADVLPGGFVRRRVFGETTVMVRYLNHQVPARLAFVPARKDFIWTDPPANNFIDTLLYAKLRRLKIHPSGLASDNVFVRRAFLDALGVLPTAVEAQRFVSDTGLDKRDRLIGQLLGRDEFADHWALKWSDILRNEEKVLDPRGVEVFYRWIHSSIATGKPLDRFVRDLIRGQGSTYENPAANFWRANRDPATRAETTARLFLGARLQCAKCHNHPFDRWTQDDYYSWAALFARIDYEIVDNERKDRLDKNEFNGEQRVLLSESGVEDPRTGRYVAPKLLGDRFLTPGSYHDRLTPLAVWLTDPDNQRFARTQVNFIWYHLMGRGLVEPIDDFRATNPPSNPALLAALAEELVRSGFDLRHLVRTIMTSRAYQRSSRPNDTNLEDVQNFSRAIVFRLPAEKMLDAQSAVLDLPADFAGYPRGLAPARFLVSAASAAVTGGPRPVIDFSRLLANRSGCWPASANVRNETTLAQTFLLIGGDLNQRLAHPGNRLARLATSASDDEIVQLLYWTALSRPPTSAERDAAARLLSTADGPYQSTSHRAWARLFAQFGAVRLPDDRFARIQDLTWALINSKEFIFRR